MSVPIGRAGRRGRGLRGAVNTMPHPLARRTRLTVETLEPRTTPAAGAWAVQSFDTQPSLPPDWSSWPVAGSIRVMPAVGLDSTPGLVIAGGKSPARVWDGSVLPTDYGAKVSLRLNGPVPVQLLVHGRHLNSAAPTYVAANIGAGGTVQLVRVIAGTSRLLATVRAHDWPADQWIEVTLQPAGDRFSVSVRRTDTGGFLNSAGNWQAAAAAALSVMDAGVTGDGQAGIAHPPSGAGQVRVDDFTTLASDLPADESFADLGQGDVPQGWTAWDTGDGTGFGGAAAGDSGTALASIGNSLGAARAWPSTNLPADSSVTAGVRVDALVPSQVFVRGRNLEGSSPTYYAASIVRGVEVRIIRVQNGKTVQLARRSSATYLSSVWLDLSLTIQGDRLQVRVQRRDTGAWLNAFGEWQADPAAALNATDGAITGAGFVGIARPAGVAGTVMFDDFRTGPADSDVTRPVVTAAIQRLAADVVHFSASARDAGGIGHVDVLVDGTVVSRLTAPPYRYDFQTRNVANGTHTLTVRAWDAAGNVGQASRHFVVNNPAVANPTIPRHFAHIRVAALAYNGNPMGADEKQLLASSIDLVIPNQRYLSPIAAVSPHTPQFIYSNVSNLYLDLLTDWLSYADRHRRPREAAFYHVAAPTAFTGDSPSSQPVDWFWNVARGPVSGTTGFTPLTAQARQTQTGGVPFAAAGGAVDIGYPDRFREINLAMSRNATGAWSGVLEYPSAVDRTGQPIAWKPVRLVSDATGGFRNSGQVTFDPPADWAPAVVSGSTARLYYVRVRTLTGGDADAPVAASVLGRDYVGAAGGKSGTIPAFDASADANHDGYLNDTEYARRRPGYDARFLYESRLFYPSYGQMRFVTNPSGTGVAAWAADYHRRLLTANPLAAGIFMDNSAGRLPTDTASLLESTDTYASDYASLIGTVNRSIAPKWVLANTSGGGAASDGVVRQVPGTIEEAALRPLAQSWAQFQDLSTLVQRRMTTGPGDLVLDSLSTGGSPTDPRTRMAALAEYYLIGDPKRTFFMAWGGEEPASAWSRHWWDAVGFDVGQPKGPVSDFATGADPANPALTYHVYERSYGKALVLYKPLSYAAGKGPGGTGDDTVTEHALDGNFRPLNADGSLGPVTRSVTLRNGEGVILVKA